MNVELLSCVKGARAADGFAVIIDVFRASNTIIALLGAGARGVIPVATLGEARELKRRGYMIGGERDGLTPQGFDFGNSPAEASRIPVNGQEAVLTTSAGTRGLLAASRAEQILIGSFANASALSRYLRNARAEKVSLVAMGLKGREKADEDELCALFIRDLVEGRNSHFQSVVEAILRSPGADRLRRLGQHEDLELCLRQDAYDIVPIAGRTGGRLRIVPASPA